jgi:hypothetical protein
VNAQASQATDQQAAEKQPAVQPSTAQQPAQGGSLTSLLLACAALAAVLIPLAAVLGAFAFARSGLIGLGAAAIAAAVCWIAASLALTAVYLGQEIKNPIAGILGGMIFRMGLPLVVILAIQRAQGPLADAGCLWMILGLYAVALVVETWLSLQLVQRLHPKTAIGAVAADAAPSGGPSVAGGISGR